MSPGKRRARASESPARWWYSQYHALRAERVLGSASMDVQNEIRDFLRSRRARITPQDAGLPVFGGTRRVPGLRRAEAAMVAGVSVEYYTKMERGQLGGVSESVLDALARGLKL